MEQINVNSLPEMEGVGGKEMPLSIEDVIRTAGIRKPSSFVNALEVEKGLKKVVVVIGAVKAYSRTFKKTVNGKVEEQVRPYVDMLVNSMSDYRKGEEMTFSLNETQTSAMKTLFSEDHNRWNGKILRLVSVNTGLKNDKGEVVKTVVIDKD